MIERNEHIEGFLNEEANDPKTARVGVKSWAIRNTLVGAWLLLEDIHKHLIEGKPFRLLLEHKGDTGDERDSDHIYIFDLTEKDDQP